MDNFIEKFHHSGDPNINDYFLMSNPFHIPLTLLAYVIFVLKVGPAFMKNRAPFNIDTLVILYNLTQIVVNILLPLSAIPMIKTMQLNYFCTPMTDPNSPFAEGIARFQYCYFLIKLLDLVETVFFVLRKKNNQVSFLHVYHHVLMAFFIWLGSKYFIGGHNYILGLPNVTTHSFMYVYYFLTAWDPKYKKSVWWKRHLTQLQILHQGFILISFAMVLVNPNCDYPKVVALFIVLNGIVMVTLFTQFYYKHYLQKAKK